MPDSIKHRLDLAWAAGFIDGEGSLSIVRDTRRNRLLVRISAYNINPEPLKKLARLFGGKVRPVRRRQRSRNQRQCFTWAVQNLSAIETAEALIPYLTVKHKHAEVLHAYRVTMRFTKRNPIGVPFREFPIQVHQYREQLKTQLSALCAKSYAL